MAGSQFQPAIALTPDQVRGLWSQDAASDNPAGPRAFDPDLNDGTVPPTRAPAANPAGRVYPMKKLLCVGAVLLTAAALLAAPSLSPWPPRPSATSSLTTARSATATRSTPKPSRRPLTIAPSGRGVLVVPPGTFLTGALFFKQRVNLLVEKDGVLKGTAKQADYPLTPTRWEGVERDWTAALLNFSNMTNVVVTGEGTIDGSGTLWPSFFGRGRGRGFGGGGNRTGGPGGPAATALAGLAGPAALGLAASTAIKPAPASTLMASLSRAARARAARAPSCS